MQYAITLPEYRSLDNIIGDIPLRHVNEYYRTLDAIITHWQKKLGSDKVSTLLFIINRTLKFGKIAEKIAFPAFLEGICSTDGRQICSGLAISHNTLRKVLKELVEDGFIHTYFPAKIAGKMDTFCRYFEINFKKLQHLTHTDGVLMGILREPKTKKVPKMVDESDENSLPNLGDLSIRNKLTKVSSRLDKSNLNRSAPLATPTGALKSISKKPNIDEIIAGVKARQEEAKQKKAAKRTRKTLLSSTGLTITGTQTTLSALMKKYFPTMPGITVTAKALGTLKKRITAKENFDIDGFFEWVIGNWYDIAEKQNRAMARRERDGERSTSDPLPLSPNFDTLAYRFPYFATVYERYLVERGALGEREDRTKEENIRLRKALADRTQEANEMRRKAREAVREARIARTTKNQQQEREAPAVTRVRRVSPGRSDDYLPTWEELQQEQRKKA